ncbi:hypothetical protein HYW83_04130 [Candidatus Peregrinibacteria bacterium]|nr:hypothetical protein [Candidatus Peregrinibacteria bacterium]
MSRRTDTSIPLDLDALRVPSGPHSYELRTGSPFSVFRNVKAAARAVAVAALLGIAACATTASGSAAAKPASGSPVAAAPAAPGGPAAAPPPPVPPAGGSPAGAPPPPPSGPPPSPPAPSAAGPAPYIPTGAMPATPGVSLFRPVPDEKFVEWRGADSTNTLRVQIDRSRRRLFLATTPGAPFTLHAGCPPYWDLEMPGIPAGVTPDDAVLNATITPRMPDRGTFDVTGQASTREGQVVTAGFDCVARDVSGAELDRESLSATVASIGGVQGRGAGVPGTPAPFPFRGNTSHEGLDGNDESAGPLFAEAALALARNIKGSPENNPAVDLDFGVDPINGDSAVAHAQLGARLRAARVTEDVDTVNDSGATVATDGKVTGNTFCGFARGAWAPRLGKYVRAVFGGGPGLCHAQRLETGPNSDIPAATGVAGEVDAGIQVGGDHFGGKAGYEATFGGNDAFQTHGPFLGFFIHH